MSAIAPHSPCINVCSLGPQGWCRGCYRTLEEIAGWVRLSPQAQWTVVHAAEARRNAERARASGS